MKGLATRYAPSFALIQAHFGAGLLGMVLFAGTLTARADRLEGPFFQPVMLGLVHLCVLGWLLPIAIGALHQLVPVIFEAPVRSERLAWAALGAYVAGAALFITRFFAFRIDIAFVAGATALTTAVWLYAFNLLATLRAAGPGGRSLTGAHIVAALLYLLVASGLGLALAINLHHPWIGVDHLSVLRAHAHAAGLGFFGLLIMGAAYRLLEMFLLSYGAPERAGRAGFGLMNVAVVSLVARPWLGGPAWLLRLAVAAAGAGVVAFLWQVAAIWRRRTKRHGDVAWHHTFASLLYLALTVLAGAALALLPPGSLWWDRIALTYGLLALPGFMGSIVVGQLYKIVPFLVWLHRFSPFVGLKRVPTAAELLSERAKQAQFLSMHAGLFALAAGLLTALPALRTAGAALFAASAVMVVRNLLAVRLRKP